MKNNIKKLFSKGSMRNFIFSIAKSTFLILGSFVLVGALFSNKLYAQPTAVINVTGPTELCQTSIGEITFNATSGTPPFIFTYNVNGGAPQTVSTAAAGNTANVDTTGIVGVFTYSLISVSDATFGPQPQAGQTATLTFDPLPTASAGGSSAPICPDGGTATVSGANATNGSILWSQNGAGGITSGQTTLTPTYTAVLADSGQTITLTMTVTSTNTCAVGPTVIATYSVPVRAAIDASEQITVLPTVCQNAPDFVVFTGYNGTPPYTFTYAVNGANTTVTSVGTNSTAAVGGITTLVGPSTYNLVSIQDANCTQALAGTPITVTVNPLPNATVTGNVVQVCQYTQPYPNIVFKAFGSTAAPFYVSFLINKVLQPTITVSILDTLIFPVSTQVAGIFTYSLISVQDANGCTGSVDTATATVVVDEIPSPHFAVSPEIVTNLQPTITVTDYSIAAQNWFWEFGDGAESTLQNPGPHTYKDTGTYYIKLIVSNSAACQDSTVQPAHVQFQFTLYVPNAFSPNGDGVNDTFAPKGAGILGYSMSIYDRWGNLVFHTDDINVGWDGRANGGKSISQIDDVAAYVIDVVSIEQKSYTYYGKVTLIK